ncbi:hypothetical protein C8J56DRAFT_797853 [Mycena floridula]|nr:hypothetical protein C8J56DRAFT_797853 [Mycena floridula]
MPAANSFPSLKALIQVVEEKPMPLRPDSPLVLSPVDDEPSSSSNSSLVHTPSLTKRQHALLEVLESERAYASDLALIRQVHIPLALGQAVTFNPTPSSSSSSSSRTVSTASDSSTGSLGPPMTPEDTKIIFSNIAELAVFSDQFCDSLEEALGSIVDGGVGDDSVGALFLRIIPELEKPYKYYITRQGAADEHLSALPKTPALEAYYAHTRKVATPISHAWDLHSLLIKPVQRLLKYPLLIAAILDETPDTHPDKPNLKLARSKIEEIARNVNEERRRAEVVKGVLLAKKRPPAIALVKIKSIRGARPGNEEAAKVEMMQKELNKIDVFAQQFARNVVDWAKAMTGLVANLRTWAVSFGKVIGLSEEQGSEAFDAFVEVVEKELAPLCVQLEATINEKLLKEIAHLLMTMNQPLKLLASMDDQESLHYQLLNMNVSPKNRPPAALLEASTNYLALRAQLAAELPRYIALMDRGMGLFVLKLAEIQASFWRDVRDRWGILWEMLRVEGEMNGGSHETIAVWHNRWGDVDQVIAALNITNPRKLYQEPVPKARVASLEQPTAHAKKVGAIMMALEPVYNVSSPYPLSPSSSRGRGSIERKSIGSRASNESLPRKAKPQRSSIEDWGEYVSVPSRTRSVPPAAPEDDRGRIPRKPSFKRKISDSIRPASRHRPKTASADLPGDAVPPNPPPSAFLQHLIRGDVWSQTGKYACVVIHPCRPPAPVSYYDFPFFELAVGETYTVLQEVGHPALHPKLPLHVDDGEDCLLLCRNFQGDVGWALASFLQLLP